jgi:hypothetical protein
MTELKANVRELAEAIYSATEPPRGPVLEAISASEPKQLVCFGLMQQTRRLLLGVMALTDAGCADVSVLPLRSILENAATTRWLMEGGTEEFEEFVGDSRRTLSLAAAEIRELQPLLQALDSLIEAWTGQCRNVSLRPLEQRLSGRTAARMYALYRHFSAQAHGSLISSTFQFATSDDSIGLAKVDAADGEGSLYLAAALSAIVGITAYGRFGDEAIVHLRELHERLSVAYLGTSQPPTDRDIP